CVRTIFDSNYYYFDHW
nr:immunoglobulin heavy chain junction region [Macaca mulatta]MOY21582.1 immunoglobulin heavy chain junction region [Macaca mulatta]MOY21676.1 immunoglobulin heavy chain junction region [Macaca mulatta]MOY22363.1 immunoglobulin heavy chain junction region [Macaca mulatta]MOY22417.1 immunoglobulin heavy chain junction region [Macaca mulatta]